MTLFTDEVAPKPGRAWISPNGLKSIIKQPTKVWCVFVFKSCTTSVTDFPTDGESCCLTLLCLCDASVIKDLQGLENASLWAFCSFISQHESIKIPFFSDLVPNYLSSKITSIQRLDSSVSEGTVQLKSCLLYRPKLNFHPNQWLIGNYVYKIFFSINP